MLAGRLVEEVDIECVVDLFPDKGCLTLGCSLLGRKDPSQKGEGNKEILHFSRFCDPFGVI